MYKVVKHLKKKYKNMNRVAASLAFLCSLNYYDKVDGV